MKINGLITFSYRPLLLVKEMKYRIIEMPEHQTEKSNLNRRHKLRTLLSEFNLKQEVTENAVKVSDVEIYVNTEYNSFQVRDRNIEYPDRQEYEPLELITDLKVKLKHAKEEFEKEEGTIAIAITSANAHLMDGIVKQYGLTWEYLMEKPLDESYVMGNLLLIDINTNTLMWDHIENEHQYEVITPMEMIQKLEERVMEITFTKLTPNQREKLIQYYKEMTK